MTQSAENDAPVETLREAAALMRGRAEAAPAGEGWYVDDHTVWVLHDPDGDSASGLAECRAIWAGGAAEHIASWHPAVALAVADWLEYVADQGDRAAINHRARAMRVARAYLGEQYRG